ncbi:hypothetical protein SLEP1_g4873 [Rubroshorea leprosula]|uniref:HAT C-terminal dimerisation domain-containing protein n=1 Tax=Rubroshorea leprosula TaxID=152421 RepID=A0AAV5HZ08_9ROSI|nr:hypothetical protein SLEP1_g4873 [Rubroshorea leprosula]
MPLSTVAFEVAFSTRGRVLDEFKSSSIPRMVQALICSQDWFKSKARQAPNIEEEHELRKLEKGKIILQLFHLFSL